MIIKAFLSSSFHPDDEDLVERFKDILRGLGIETYQAKGVPDLPGNIIEQIKNHDLFVSILTPRKENQPSEYLSFEIATALATDKKTIIFRQKGVEIQKIYPHLNQKEFDRDAVIDNDENEIKAITSTILEHCRIYGFKLPEDDPDLEKRYDFAKSQSQLTGSKVLGYFNEILYRNEVRDHAVKNFPTEADSRANRFLIEAIKSDSLTKDDGIIAEESIDDIQKVRRVVEDNNYVWIIDPLDGTLNFAYGFPFFCVSLGLISRQQPVLGVLYNPTTQELYSGRKGFPSECIDLKTGIKRFLQLQTIKENLDDCIVMTHLSSRFKPRSVTLGILDKIADKCRAVRILGSGQMALASLALGQFDIFFNYSTYIWDIVPGTVILQGAGGYISSSIEEHTLNWQSLGIIAGSNSSIGEEFRKFLNRSLDKNFPTLSDHC